MPEIHLETNFEGSNDISHCYPHFNILKCSI